MASFDGKSALFTYQSMRTIFGLPALYSSFNFVDFYSLALRQ